MTQQQHPSSHEQQQQQATKLELFPDSKRHWLTEYCKHNNVVPPAITRRTWILIQSYMRWSIRMHLPELPIILHTQMTTPEEIISHSTHLIDDDSIKPRLLNFIDHLLPHRSGRVPLRLITSVPAEVILVLYCGGTLRVWAWFWVMSRVQDFRQPCVGPRFWHFLFFSVSVSFVNHWLCSGRSNLPALAVAFIYFIEPDLPLETRF